MRSIITSISYRESSRLSVATCRVVDSRNVTVLNLLLSKLSLIYRGTNGNRHIETPRPSGPVGDLNHFRLGEE